MIKHSPVFQWGKSFLDNYDLTPYSTILDVGCRNGALSAYLANQYQYQTFISIDNSNDEIEQAKSYYKIPNLNFETADILSLGYTEKFDAVVSLSCLHWIIDKARAAKNIYHALKPGGKAFLQFFALHGRLKNDQFFYQVAKDPKWKNYFKNFSPDYFEINLWDVIQLLTKAGFIIHRIEFKKYNSIFEHSDILHQWLKTWVSHINRLSCDKQDVFLKEGIDRYRDFHDYQRNQAFSYDEYVLEVVCEKPLENLIIDANLCQGRYGSVVFTAKEITVLKYYLQGKSSKEISVYMLVSPKTIEFHLANIKSKLNCHRRSEIYQAALSQGFINLVF